MIPKEGLDSWDAHRVYFLYDGGPLCEKGYDFNYHANFGGHFLKKTMYNILNVP